MLNETIHIKNIRNTPVIFQEKKKQHTGYNDVTMNK